jgi:hypothetical protein
MEFIVVFEKHLDAKILLSFFSFNVKIALFLSEMGYPSGWLVSVIKL